MVLSMRDMLRPMMEVAATTTNMAMSLGGTLIFSPLALTSEPPLLLDVNRPMDDVQRKCSPQRVVANEKP